MRVRAFAFPLLCCGFFLLANLLIWPVVESGIADDWSIVRTAQLLAETGHVHYNGWEAPMLGWPLYVAALVFRVFGFSFTAARVTTMIEATATVFLMQRIFVRCGAGKWNSVLGTLALALSPIFVISTVTFATDLPGLFAVIVCLYACLRAVQAGGERSAAGWICFAALANAGLGTTRQIAWLGVIVMVPSAMWVLRRSRLVLAAGAASWMLSMGFIAAALHWFKQQPYILPEHLMLNRIQLGSVPVALESLTRIGLDVVLLLLPVALSLLASVGRVGRAERIRFGGIVGVVLLGLIALVVFAKGNHLAPFLLYPYVTQTAENTFLSFPMPLIGTPVLPPDFRIRILLTVAVMSGVAAIIVSLLLKRREPVLADEVLPWPNFLALTVPFGLAYLALLMPRAIFIFTIDRYLLFLLPIALLLLVRLYQSRVGPQLPKVCVVLLGLLGLYSVTTLHDAFATYRADFAAVQEMRAAGVPRTAISGGLEYNFTTELLAGPYIHAGGIRRLDGTIEPGPKFSSAGPCSQVNIELTPVVQPTYVTAYPMSSCERANGFAPIRYSTWLPPFHREVEIVRYVYGVHVPE